MHRIGLWCSIKSAKPNDFQFPYTAISPTLGKPVTYTEDEIWNEIDRIIAEDVERKSKYSLDIFTCAFVWL